MVRLIAMLMLVGQVLTTIPSIVYNESTFRVSYAQGAVWGCTVFQQQKVGPITDNYPDGRYTPKHCWSLTKDSTYYDDDWAFIDKADTDWLVWGEIQYLDGHDQMSTVTTNKVKVHR